MANEHNASPRIVAALSAALLTGVAPAALASDGSLAETPLPAVREIPDFRFPSWIELGGYFGTNGTSRGELTLWTPLTQGPDNLTFFELRTKVFEGSAVEGNFALGYRRQMPSGFNLGAWGGLDVRDTRQDNTFWQLSGGLEALSERIDARVNAYWPLTGPQAGDGSTAQVQLQGNNILMTGGAEVALRGVDAEIGRRIDFGPATLAGYFGGYYFDHPDAFEDVAGGKARAELFFDDFMTSGGRLSFDYEFSYDDVREARHEVGLRLRLPIGGNDRADLASLSPQQLRMMDGLERDTDIVIGRSEQERVEDALTGTDFDRVAFIEDGDTVTDVSAQAGDNSLLIQNVDLDGAQTLNGDQTLQGGGSTIAVRGLRFGGLGAFTAPGTPGAPPKITNTSNSAVLAIEGTNTHVAGLALTGGGKQLLPNDNDGIHVDQPSFFGAFTQLSIFDAGGDGIHIGGEATEAASGHVTVTRSGLFADVEIDNVGGDGVYIGGGAAIVTGDGDAITTRTGTFTNVAISNAGSYGILIAGDESQVVGNGTVITDSTGTFTDVAISNTGYAGVRFGGGGGELGGDGDAITNRIGTFTNVSVSGTSSGGFGDSGVSISGGAAIVRGNGSVVHNRIGTFTNVTMSDVGGSGVSLTGGLGTVEGDGSVTGNRTATLTDVSISNTGYSGLTISGGAANVRGNGTAANNRTANLTNVSMSNIGNTGVNISGGSSNVNGDGTATNDRVATLNNVSITNTGLNGGFFSNGSGVNISGGPARVEGEGTATTNRTATLTDVSISNVNIGGGYDGAGVFVGGYGSVAGYSSTPTANGYAETNNTVNLTNVTISGVTGGSGVAIGGQRDTYGTQVYGDGTAITNRTGNFQNVTISDITTPENYNGAGIYFGGLGSQVSGNGTAITNHTGTLDVVSISNVMRPNTGTELAHGVQFGGTDSEVGGAGPATTNRTGDFSAVTIGGITHGSGVFANASAPGTNTFDFNGVTIEDIATGGIDGFGVLFAGDGDVTASFTNVMFLGDIGSGGGTALLGADGATISGSGVISDQTDNTPAVCFAVNGGAFEGTATVDGTPLLTINCVP